MRLLREQYQNKDKKTKENLDKKKKLIDSLKTENEELRSQIDFYEKMRINNNNKNNKSRNNNNNIKKINKKEVEISQSEESVSDNINDDEGKEENEKEDFDDVDLIEVIKETANKKSNKKPEITKILNIFYKKIQNPIPAKDKGTLKINNENYKFDENTHYKKYKFNKNKSKEVVKEEENEGKMYKTFSDGRKEIKFGNGAIKEIMPDNYIIGNLNN